MRIALATCAELPDWEVDDLPFHEALIGRGVELHHPVWSDPNEDWSQYDAVLIRTTWDYTGRKSQFVEWAQHVETVSQLFNPASVIRWNTDKRYLGELELRGVRTVPTLWVQQGQSIDLAAELEERGWERGFLKPCVGATAEGTLRFDRSELEVAQRHLDRLVENGAAMVQPYRHTVETEGEVSALIFGGVISHCVRKVPVEGDYRVQDDFGASDEPTTFSEEDQILALAALAAAEDALGTRLLYARADFLHGPHGLEMNELELVEPSLFFRHDPLSPGRLADALLRSIAPRDEASTQIV